jgi:hypothetical protein
VAQDPGIAATLLRRRDTRSREQTKGLSLQQIKHNLTNLGYSLYTPIRGTLLFNRIAR